MSDLFTAVWSGENQIVCGFFQFRQPWKDQMCAIKTPATLVWTYEACMDPRHFNFQKVKPDWIIIIIWEFHKIPKWKPQSLWKYSALTSSSPYNPMWDWIVFWKILTKMFFGTETTERDFNRGHTVVYFEWQTQSKQVLLVTSFCSSALSNVPQNNNGFWFSWVLIYQHVSRTGSKSVREN